jgi:hypothetical protein
MVVRSAHLETGERPSESTWTSRTRPHDTGHARAVGSVFDDGGVALASDSDGYQQVGMETVTIRPPLSGVVQVERCLVNDLLFGPVHDNFGKRVRRSSMNAAASVALASS